MKLISISDPIGDAFGYGERFRAMSNEQLVEAYNQEVGNPGCISRRADYLSHLRMEIMARDLDASAIITNGEMALDFRVELYGNCLEANQS